MSVSGTWSRLCHSNSTLPVATSISWTIESSTFPPAGPPTDVEVGLRLGVHGEQRGALGVSRNSWTSAL